MTRIPFYNLGRLENEIAAMNEKAKKLGSSPVRLILGQRTETYDELRDITYAWIEVDVEGETPRLDGWALVASVEPQENGEKLLRCVPGRECPEGYRTRDNSCDHCKTKRFRKEVFVLHHDATDRYVQVGRQCISDFLGGKSPESLIADATWRHSVASTVEEASGYGWGGGEITVPTESVLATAAAVCEVVGWVSKKMCQEATDRGEIREPTSSHVSTLLWPVFGREQKEKQKELDRRMAAGLTPEKAAKVLRDWSKAWEWAKGLVTTGDTYLDNLGVIARNISVNNRNLGMACSIIPAWKRAMEAEEAKKREASTPKPRGVHVGEEGKRSQFAVKCEKVQAFDSDYGTKHLCRFKDADGNTLIWWASGKCDWVKEGGVYHIFGTVKRHSEYKGVPQTELSRVAEVGPGYVEKKPRVKKEKAA